MEEKSRESNESAFKYSGSDDSCFNCNICLESVEDPVITLCGHLYCWPCIYKWLRIENEHQTCPICKSKISLSSLVPLYGCGTSNSDSGTRTQHMGLEIPPRPPSYIMNNVISISSTNALASHQQIAPFQIQGAVINSSNQSNDLLGHIMSSDANMYAYFHDLVNRNGGIPNMRRRQEMEIFNSFVNGTCILILICIITSYLIIWE
ncbi:hypothetical protein RIF29_39133 [Crotalaria pallida]|uniref:E3 ubiquitin-protein ligase RMA n=1 Tax=Crotalaria pallida TaxID=3830 RepID=A0AAN9E3N3_CROPI